MVDRPRLPWPKPPARAKSPLTAPQAGSAASIPPNPALHPPPPASRAPPAERRPPRGRRWSTPGDRTAGLGACPASLDSCQSPIDTVSAQPGARRTGFGWGIPAVGGPSVARANAWAKRHARSRAGRGPHGLACDSVRRSQLDKAGRGPDRLLLRPRRAFEYVLASPEPLCCPLHGSGTYRRAASARSVGR